MRLADLPRAIIERAQAFMVIVGYLMALAAFFVTLSQLGDISLELRVVMWALLAVPILYALALSAEQIRQNAASQE